MQTKLIDYLKSMGLEFTPFDFSEYEKIVEYIMTSQGFPSGMKAGNVKHAYAVLARDAMRRY